MDFNQIIETARRSTFRVLRSDFGRDEASSEERAALSAGPGRITEALAQDYAAWRGSVLLLASIVMGIGAILHLLNFETISDAMTGPQVEALGPGNVSLLDKIAWIMLLATLATTGLTIFAAVQWKNPARSIFATRIAWLILIGTPLLLAITPWSRLLDLSSFTAAEAKQVKGMIGLALGLSFFFMVAPKLLSIFPGIIRASVTLKTLLHESPAPGYMVVLFAPFYAMFVLVIFTMINQMQGNLTLLVGIGCLVIAPLVYLWRGKEFLRAHTAEESAVLVRGVRKQALVFNAIGTAIVILFLLDMDDVEFTQVLEFMISAGGGVLLMTAVAADAVTGLLRMEHQQAKAWAGTDLAAAFDRKLEALDLGQQGAAPPTSEQEPWS